MGMVNDFPSPPLGAGKVMRPLTKSMHLRGMEVSLSLHPVASAISKAIVIHAGCSGRAWRMISISSFVIAGFTLGGVLASLTPSSGLYWIKRRRTA